MAEGGDDPEDAVGEATDLDGADGPATAPDGTDESATVPDDVDRTATDPADPGAAGDSTDAVGDDPLSDLAREVRARRTDGETDPGVEDDPFESVDVAEVDSEAIWEAFLAGETDAEDRVGLGASVRDAEADEHVVPKAEFCQRCPHFADPPETACTHEDTTIVEVVDTDHFRVRNCPIADAERESPSVD